MNKSEKRKLYRLSDNVHNSAFMGSRIRALKIREDLEQALLKNPEVEIDFANINIGQSFADELIGVLVLKHGPDILRKLIFKNCSDIVKTTIQFVVTDRYDEFIRKRAH